jgi:hypothetical protein
MPATPFAKDLPIASVIDLSKNPSLDQIKNVMTRNSAGVGRILLGNRIWVFHEAVRVSPGESIAESIGLVILGAVSQDSYLHRLGSNNASFTFAQPSKETFEASAMTITRPWDLPVLNEEATVDRVVSLTNVVLRRVGSPIQLPLEP